MPIRKDFDILDERRCASCIGVVGPPFDDWRRQPQVIDVLVRGREATMQCEVPAEDVPVRHSAIHGRRHAIARHGSAGRALSTSCSLWTLATRPFVMLGASCEPPRVGGLQGIGDRLFDIE